LEALRGSLFRRRRLDVGIAVAVGAFIGVFIVGFALRSVSAKPVPQVGALRATTTNATTSVAAGRAPIGIARSSNESTSATGAKTKASASTFTSSAPATPTFDVLSLPQAQVGTISVAHSAAGHRLFIDGSVYNNGTAMVSCGRHVVRVGSHGRAQAVDLNCGSDVVVAP
jgi:hypothetical protein